MKRIIFVFMSCLVFSFFLTTKAIATWPPSTSLEEPTTQTLTSGGEEASQAVRSLVDKIEEDQRRLESALHELKEDHKALQQVMGIAKEDPDGHRLH